MPLAEFEKTSNQMQQYKNKCADLMERCNALTKQNADMQTKMRLFQTAETRLNLYEEMQIDAENELELVKRRLEVVDPEYKWENSIFDRVTQQLKSRKVSPDQLFQYFDKGNKGRLSSGEFFKALDRVGVTGLTGDDRDKLLTAIDFNNDGWIDV